MAPRGRPRKRSGKMDAAVNAMAPYGFDETIVEKTVNQLLKVYGGDEGWPFIIEYGYNVLIEALLQDQVEDPTPKGASSQDERTQDSTLQSNAGQSHTLVDSTSKEASNTVGESTCSELGGASGEPTLKELFSKKLDVGNSEVSIPRSAAADRNSWKDIGEDQTSTQKDDGNANAVSGDDGNIENQVQKGNKSHVVASPPSSSPCSVNRPTLCSGTRVQSGSNLPVSTPPPASSPCPVNLEPQRKRFPCYGWIDSDDEDEPELIFLTPMKPGTPLQSQNSSGGTGKREKRKSRWDVRPNDP